MHYHTIIISDLHLGTKNTQHNKLLNFLQENTCDHLILNGDIIDTRHLRFFRRRIPSHTTIIKQFLQLAQSNTKVTYIYGNHDTFRQNILPITLHNIDIRQDLLYVSGDKTYYICHGQQFDKPNKIGLIEWTGFVAGMFFFWINRCYNKRRAYHKLPYKPIIRGIKQLAKDIMTGGRKTFERNVLKMIHHHKVDGLICGHIHRAEMSKINGYDYFNSGDRIDSCTALVEHQNHERELIEWKK